MKNSKNPGAAIGLDVGTSRIVLAQKSEEEYSFVSQLNAFVSIPFSKMTVATLEKEGVPHVVENGEIVVHGNESAKFAELMNVDIRRPMTKGTLDPKEPESLKLVRKIIGSHGGRGRQGGAEDLLHDACAADRRAGERDVSRIDSPRDAR